ncbi:MAG: stage V sporulation protein AE [Clostridiales bacterium]|nr:stage V sporulation protein AE [Clostridiales bacterium]
MFNNLLPAFLVGGILCAIAQLLIDKTKLTPARIVVLYVVVGVVLTGVGLYEPVVDFGGAGATVPIIGFGYALAKGVSKGIETYGLMGVLSGGLTATAAGIGAAILFGYVAALFARPAAKS